MWIEIRSVWFFDDLGLEQSQTKVCRIKRMMRIFNMSSHGEQNNPHNWCLLKSQSIALESSESPPQEGWRKSVMLIGKSAPYRHIHICPNNNGNIMMKLPGVCLPCFPFRDSVPCVAPNHTCFFNNRRIFNYLKWKCIVLHLTVRDVDEKINPSMLLKDV